MRRKLLLAASSCVLAACGSGGGGATAPDDDLAPLTPPRHYVGKAEFSRTTVSDGAVDTLAFAGNVTWVTEDVGPAPRDYTILSGTMAVAHEMDLRKKCTLKGSTTFELEPGDGALVVFQEGRYSGAIKREVKFLSKVSCPGSSAPFADSGTIELRIEGSLIDGRMEGTMAPIVATATTFKGSWRFTPNL